MFHLSHRLPPIAIGACVCILLAASSADAATRTWKADANNGFWSNPNNWQEGVIPGHDDDIVLPRHSMSMTNTVNDILDLRVRSFFVTGQYIVSGQPLVIGEGGLRGDPNLAGFLIIDVLGTLGANQTWDTSGLLIQCTGDLRLGASTLTLDANVYYVAFQGVITGAGTIIKNGPADLRLHNLNTYTGRTIVNRGHVVAYTSNALGVGDGTPANGTVINAGSPDGGSLLLGVETLGNEHITASGRGFQNQGALRTNGVATLTGPIELVGETLVVSFSTGILRFEGPISGSGRLLLWNTGFYFLANSGNSFTGGVQFGPNPEGATSKLIVEAPNALPGTPVIDLAFRQTLDINANAVTIDSLKGHGDSNVTVHDPPNLGVLILKGQGEATYNGALIGGGVIIVDGMLNQTFTSDHSIFNGNVFVGPGTLTLTNKLPAARTTVERNGRLALKANGGVSGELLVLLATLQVGAGAASMVTSGPLTLRPFATFEVSGSLPNTLAKLAVTGAVDLDDAMLSLALPEGFSPTVGQAFTILENDGADAIVGTFAGLPEGSTISARGVTFGISYVGGTGNDVVLTVTNVVREYYLSEGATGSFFTTDILIANPGLLSQTITVTFLKSDGTSVVLDDHLPAQSHRTLRVNGVAGMEATTFSTIVKSTVGLPLVVERTMSWDTTGYGSHTERAVDGPAKTWYFAEGSQGFFSTYVLLANPQPSANIATVQYLIENAAPITRIYELAPSSRFTIDIGADAALVNQSFGMTVTFDQPGIAERAMYFGSSPLWKAGHESAGVTAPSTTWFLAEGATGPFFETFVLLANPNMGDVTATLTFLPASGPPVVRTKTIPANGRVTVNIEAEDPSLANAAVATTVSSPAPIIVERSQYWPDPASQWYEAHNSFGVIATGTSWGLAEGRVGGDNNAQTYILLANPGTEPALVEIRFLRENASFVGGNFRVEPGTRLNVAVGGFIPTLNNENFGAVITSSQPIVVERALYWDANGVTWAAGSNATATRLPF